MSRGSSANPVEPTSVSPSSSFAIEQTPIIYAQSLLSDTSSTHDTLRQLEGNFQTGKPPVVQAKLDRINNPGDTPSLSSLSLPVVKSSGVLTPQLQKKQEGNKFDSLSSHAASALPINSERNPLLSDLPSPELPIIYAHPLAENSQSSSPPVNKRPVVQISPNLNSILPRQPDPLIFCSPSAIALQQASAVNPTRLGTKQYQAALRPRKQAAPGLAIEGTLEPIYQNKILQSPPTNSYQSITGVQINETTINSKADSQPKVNLDTLADKVERKLMRRLIVESERRGQKQWC